MASDRTKEPLETSVWLDVGTTSAQIHLGFLGIPPCPRLWVVDSLDNVRSRE
jgi:hypothetical protein